MDRADELCGAARDAFGARDWARARDLLLAARELRPLSADEEFLLGDAAWWLGLVDESLHAGEAAYRLYLHGDQPRRAAMSAIGIAVSLFLRGEYAIGSGWMSRAQRLLRDEPENVEHGYATYLLEVEDALDGPDLAAVVDAARRVQAIGRRHDDPNLISAGLLGEGRALLRQGEVARGMALLDEAMVAVMADELAPDWAGNIYCHLMAACWELQDVRRAAEWTAATERWLTGLPAAVLFSGICRVHRTQILHLQGLWDRAEAEALRVATDLARIHLASAAESQYALGEIRRLRGDFAGADAAFREAHERGRDPQPGLALLQLAQGRTAVAVAGIRAALAATVGRLPRARLLSARVEIELAAGDIDAAREACATLEEYAAVFGSSGLEASALQARGAVLLAAGRPAEALPVLRASWRGWRHISAPYEAARVRELMADAYRKLADEAGAELELNAARIEFDRLGAVVDARRIAAVVGRPERPGGLTVREAEVIGLIATGMTNREVAAALVLSEKTVARHLSNIFDKLGVSTRTEAAAYAFEHGLARRTRG